MKAMWVLLVVCLVPSMAFADGGVFYEEVAYAAAGPATTPVEATAQRALLWYRSGRWELTIQPIFPREAGRAAWIVPFVAKPHVQKGGKKVLDALDLVTTPVFFDFCVEVEEVKYGLGFGEGGCCGAPGSATGGAEEEGDSRVSKLDQDVTVWEQGSVADYDYVILEAKGTEAAAGWLNDNGYHVPEELVEEPWRLEDRFIFAATLSEDLPADKPLSPLTFVFGDVGIDDMAYPLKLTALVAPDEGTDLLIWVVTPKEWITESESMLVPTTHAWVEYVSGVGVTHAEWEEERSVLVASLPPEGGLIVEYHGDLYSNEIYRSASWGGHWIYLESETGYGDSIHSDEIGLDLPHKWPEAMEEMAFKYIVTRYRGHLTSAAMDEDLRFEPSYTQKLTATDPLHPREVSCDELEEEPPPEADVAGSVDSPLQKSLRGMAILLLGAFLGFVALRRAS